VTPEMVRVTLGSMQVCRRKDADWWRMAATEAQDRSRPVLFCCPCCPLVPAHVLSHAYWSMLLSMILHGSKCS
jgi:hypothetical protein